MDEFRKTITPTILMESYQKTIKEYLTANYKGIIIVVFYQSEITTEYTLRVKIHHKHVHYTGEMIFKSVDKFILQDPEQLAKEFETDYLEYIVNYYRKEVK